MDSKWFEQLGFEIINANVLIIFRYKAYFTYNIKCGFMYLYFVEKELFSVRFRNIMTVRVLL